MDFFVHFNEQIDQLFDRKSKLLKANINSTIEPLMKEPVLNYFHKLLSQLVGGRNDDLSDAIQMFDSFINEEIPLRDLFNLTSNRYVLAFLSSPQSPIYLEFLQFSILRELQNAKNLIQQKIEQKQQPRRETCTNLRKLLYNWRSLTEEKLLKSETVTSTRDPIDFTRDICKFIELQNQPIELLRGGTDESLQVNFLKGDNKQFIKDNKDLTFFVFASPGVEFGLGEEKGKKLYPNELMTFEKNDGKKKTLVLNAVTIYLYNHYSTYFRCEGLWWYYDTLSERPLEAARYEQIRDYLAVYGTLFWYQDSSSTPLN